MRGKFEEIPDYCRPNGMGLADVLTPILVVIVPPFSSKQCLAETFAILSRMLGVSAAKADEHHSKKRRKLDINAK